MNTTDPLNTFDYYCTNIFLTEATFNWFNIIPLMKFDIECFIDSSFYSLIICCVDCCRSSAVKSLFKSYYFKWIPLWKLKSNTCTVYACKIVMFLSYWFQGQIFKICAVTTKYIQVPCYVDIFAAILLSRWINCNTTQ